MIRPFEPRDDEAIVALFSRLHAHDPSIDAPTLEGWRGYRGMKLFDEGRRFLIVEDEGRVVALSTLGEMHGVQRVRILRKAEPISGAGSRRSDPRTPRSRSARVGRGRD